jgi:hypothetical protein
MGLLFAAALLGNESVTTVVLAVCVCVLCLCLCFCFCCFVFVLAVVLATALAAPRDRPSGGPRDRLVDRPRAGTASTRIV